ncbi:MAG: hypothetical protein ACRD29_23105 [Acidimicrobiales bacterium]
MLEPTATAQPSVRTLTLAEYEERVALAKALVPGLRLEFGEYAVNGDSLLVHWVATGTNAYGPFQLAGVDHVRLSA